MTPTGRRTALISSTVPASPTERPSVRSHCFEAVLISASRQPVFCAAVAACTFTQCQVTVSTSDSGSLLPPPRCDQGLQLSSTSLTSARTIVKHFTSTNSRGESSVDSNGASWSPIHTTGATQKITNIQLWHTNVIVERARSFLSTALLRTIAADAAQTNVTSFFSVRASTPDISTLAVARDTQNILRTSIPVVTCTGQGQTKRRCKSHRSARVCETCGQRVVAR